MTNNYFQTLNSIDVNGKIEQKNGLNYLSWAWAWGELKKLHPDATYKVYENEQGWCYFTDNRTGWVKTGVTVNGIEHIEYLPIMDYRNKSIPLDNITSFDVNKTIQRSLTKAVARHGLGLYIYAGEDLPEGEEKEKPKATPIKKPSSEQEYNNQIDAKAAEEASECFCSDCGVKISRTVANYSTNSFGKRLCMDCQKKAKKAVKSA